MSKILVIIMVEEDGTSFRFGSNLELMNSKFEEAKDQELYDRVTLVEVEKDSEIGFGVDGDFYGGEVIDDWIFYGEDDEEEEEA